MKGAISIFSFLVASSVPCAFAQEGPTVQSGMTVSVLKVASASGHPSAITIGSGNNQYSIGVDSLDNFVIAHGSSPLLVADSRENIHITAPSFAASNLDLRGEIKINGVPQFRLVAREDLSNGAKGWDNTASKDIVSQCAGITMLGGFGKFAKGEVTKKYTQLPPHKELRIKANYHFIDAWVGETGFMRLSIGQGDSLQYVWTERHSQDLEQEAVNVCGGVVGEGKFSVPIDVVVAHDKDNITVGFGSTMDEDDPFDQSWGVSNIEIYIR